MTQDTRKFGRFRGYEPDLYKQLHGNELSLIIPNLMKVPDTKTHRPAIPEFRAVSRPTLGSLMGLYEDNFRLLEQLVDDLGGFEGGQVSCATNAIDLHLKALERGPYTTLLSLTCFLGEDEGAQPDFRIRVGFDSRSAEVISFQGVGGTVIQGATDRVQSCRVYSTLDWKWQINNFLHKWLHFCLEMGHRFDEEVEKPTAIA